MYIARKSLGQHFLTDQFVLQQIVQAIAPDPAQTYVEIGPGLGALTKLILPLAHRLTVIEYDKNIIPLLQQNCAGLGELNIQQADILNVDFTQLAAGRKLCVFGNLPYNISTPILFHVLEHISVIQQMLFMLQQEVVERIVAKPHNKDYGRLSVMIQYYCETQQLFTVPPNAFNPPPKVNSAVVRLIPRDKAALQRTDITLFAEVVKLAFQQRRKTIRNSLKEKVSIDIIMAANIDPQARAENLSVEDFVRMTNLLKN